jgi:hypothetical protein
LIDSGVPLMIIQILPRAMWDGSQLLLLLGWQVMAEKRRVVFHHCNQKRNNKK